MTEQRALERKVEEERLKAIGAFPSWRCSARWPPAVAHGINNPLGIIELLARPPSAIDRGDAAGAREAIAGIRAAASRAGAIVQGLSRFSRESQGEARADVVVAAVVADAVGLCRARIAGDAIALTVDVTTTARVEGHAIELTQVLVNLLNNARDAARAVEPAWIRLTAHDVADARAVEIAVEDAGPPLPADAAEQNLRPFFASRKGRRGHRARPGRQPRRRRRHRGTLTLDAETAACTRFVLRLPAVQR